VHAGGGRRERMEREVLVEEGVDAGGEFGHGGSGMWRGFGRV
jgi:hypothetical protein